MTWPRVHPGLLAGVTASLALGAILADTERFRPAAREAEPVSADPGPCPREPGEGISSRAVAFPCSAGGTRWRVRSLFSAFEAIVIEVDTPDVDDVGNIARRIAPPLQGRFGEILIYACRPGGSSRAACRRVQWTAQHGYRELTFDRYAP